MLLKEALVDHHTYYFGWDWCCFLHLAPRETDGSGVRSLMFVQILLWRPQRSRLLPAGLKQSLFPLTMSVVQGRLPYSSMLEKTARTKTKKYSAAVYYRVPRLLEAKG